MADIASGLHAGGEGRGNFAFDPGRIWRRWRLLARIRRRNANRAIVAMGMDERQLVDLGLQARRRRYDWIEQMVMAMSIR